MAELTTKTVRELMDYCPQTGVFTWRSRPLESFKSLKSWKIWNKRFSGKKAGTVFANSNGYKRVTIRLLGTRYLAHRLAFLHMGEALPEQVDHIDRNATNNKWSNLRASREIENSKNRSMPSNNTSGVTGVHWCNKRYVWHARATLNGKLCHLGYFDEGDLDLAAMEVLEFRAEGGFDPQHGLTAPHYYSGGTP